MPESRTILLGAHEERLRDLEREVGAINKEVLPYLARLEAMMQNGFERVTDRLDRGEQRFEQLQEELEAVEKAISADNRANIDRDVAIKKLQDDLAERVERKKTLKNRAAGVVIAVITTAILAILGLK